MKVKELKQALAKCGPELDDKEIQVWLPGSRILLRDVFFISEGVMIEGNVKPGSALDTGA